MKSEISMPFLRVFGNFLRVSYDVTRVLARTEIKAEASLARQHRAIGYHYDLQFELFGSGIFLDVLQCVLQLLILLIGEPYAIIAVFIETERTGNLRGEYCAVEVAEGHTSERPRCAFLYLFFVLIEIVFEGILKPTITTVHAFACGMF